MKNLQHFYLQSYRFTGFIFLLGLISSILWYGFSILFFSTSSTWSVPLILSPNQEKVITHMEHLLNLEHELAKEIADLKTAKKTIESKEQLITKYQSLRQLLKQSMSNQAERYTSKSLSFHALNLEKKNNIKGLNRLVAQVKDNEDELKVELKMGLITKQEAVKEQLALSTLHSYLVQERTGAHELEQRAIDFANAADTLDGAATNLLALQNIIKKNELDTKIAELKVDSYAYKVSSEHLEKDIKKRERALARMRNNPYILATKRPTTVAFLPYVNLNHIKKGDPVYSCYFDMIVCHQSGYIAAIYSAEEYGTHPIFKSELKGQLLRIAYTDKKDAQKKLLFLNAKPLLI